MKRDQIITEICVPAGFGPIRHKKEWLAFHEEENRRLLAVKGARGPAVYISIQREVVKKHRNPELKISAQLNLCSVLLVDGRPDEAERLLAEMIPPKKCPIPPSVCPFSWPVSAANLKRCLLVTRVPVEGTDKELVLVNLHLEAYDDGEGKIAQTRQLMALLEEYAKGNFVIAGGDFNQTFPGGLDAFPVQDSGKWTPGTLEADILSEGWQFACDTSAATCRLLDAPWDGAQQLYVIDGFILSPNVTLNGVETVDLDFACSDHNPVRLSVTLGTE